MCLSLSVLQFFPVPATASRARLATRCAICPSSSPRDLEFMCRALNIEKTETRCYKQAQSRKALLGDLPYVFDFQAVEKRIIKMTDYPDKVYTTAPLKRL